MSWLTRTWAMCTWRGAGPCEEEILRTRAEAAGWYAKPEGGWLCPKHRPDKVTWDVQSRAAGERDEED